MGYITGTCCVCGTEHTLVSPKNSLNVDLIVEEVKAAGREISEQSPLDLNNENVQIRHIVTMLACINCDMSNSEGMEAKVQELCEAAVARRKNVDSALAAVAETQSKKGSHLQTVAKLAEGLPYTEEEPEALRKAMNKDTHTRPLKKEEPE